ncbi:MAG: isoprenylcysteine carboxylmethyltransferase family protein [Anaerolineales bacterium]
MKYLRAFVFFLSTVLLYLGLASFGWGFDNLRGFFSLVPRLGYALSVVLFAAAVGVQALSGTEGIRGGKGEESKWNRRESIVRVVLILGLYLAITFIPIADRRGIAVIAEGAALRWLGVALGALGYALIFRSGLALGRQYSAEVTIQKDHRLITTGPYKWIRYPRYLGIVALAIGLSLAFRSWIGLTAALVVFGILVLRIHDEEALLHREFGEEWERYAQKSWRMIPGIF